MRTYKQLPPGDRDRLNDALARQDIEAIHEAILALAVDDEDWHWVQERALSLLDHNDWTVRAVAATSLGHIARIHGQLDIDRVMAAFRRHFDDPQVSGYIRVAIENIQQFVETA